MRKACTAVISKMTSDPIGSAGGLPADASAALVASRVVVEDPCVPADDVGAEVALR
jgi:hypothetical protein